MRHPLATIIGGLTLTTLACQEVPRTYSTRANTGTLVYDDDFERQVLGSNWHASGPGARIEDGALVVEDLHNHPLWLTKPLPANVRIEFDAWTPGDDGDIKVELAGDGKSASTSANYVSTGYVVVFGGWNNTLSTIARMSEHSADRVTIDEPKVEAGRRYHFAITRKGGELRWELDGVELLAYVDPQPLLGPTHAHFAFGGWEAEVHFDNLVIEAI